MNVIIVGQGISGTWLSYWLIQMGVEVLVVDDASPVASSRVASGVINPVTGRQVVTTWLADTLLPFSEKHYQVMGAQLGKNIIQNTGILAFPPSQQMMEAYLLKVKEGSLYINSKLDWVGWNEFFNFNHGIVEIRPAYWVDLTALLTGWQDVLMERGYLLKEIFDEAKLKISDSGMIYEDYPADYIIYCTGPKCFQSKWWSGLPFSFNKGEALIVGIPGLPGGNIYKFGITTLVPWQDGLWWAGSSYDNRFEDDGTTTVFRTRIELFLKHTLKLPFEVLGHLAAIRPATVERRPFAGMHPLQPRIGILNGMGTKGVSVAPWLAWQLAQQLQHGTPIDPAADVGRFKRAFMT